MTTTTNPCTAANLAAGKIFFPYPNDNTKFIECNRLGQPQVLSCPSRLVYSAMRQSCLLPEGQTGGTGTGTGGISTGTGIGGGTVTGTVINPGNVLTHGQSSFTICENQVYRKNSKNWDTLNYYRDCPTNGIVGFYGAILCSKNADSITNLRSSLIWVCTVCSDLSVPRFQIITVFTIDLAQTSSFFFRSC